MVCARVGGTMKKIVWAALLILVLAACGKYDDTGQPKGPVTPPQLPSGSIKHPLETQVAGIQRPLVDQYYRIIQGEDGNKEANAQDFKYQPRQSSFEGYKGWDMLSVPGPWATPTDGKWLTLSLNRDAVLTVLIQEWAEEAQATTWLQDWKKGSSSAKNERGENVIYVTYSKDFAVGSVTLPPIENYGYTLLLAEKGGIPSTEPILPEGVTERPQPNESCPAWLSSDVWVAPGIDSKLYKTWHPQIDPIYWCYYEHDHGSDPSLVGYQPTFEYIAFVNNNQPELHEGFKGFAIQDTEKDIGWYINIHSETGVISRVCTRVHTVVFAATKLSTGEKLLELGYKGDFGAMIGTFNGAEDKVVQPTLANCPNQQAIADETNASRRIRIGKDNHNYERWDGGANRFLGMTFPEWSTGMGVDIRNPATACFNESCSSAIPTDENADRRTIGFTDLSIKYDKVLDASDGKPGDGYFLTDVYGEFNGDASKDVVRQFIKPGFEALLDERYSTEDPWRSLYVPERAVPGLELEDSLGLVN
jgi:hypothetical protein